MLYFVKIVRLSVNFFQLGDLIRQMFIDVALSGNELLGKVL